MTLLRPIDTSTAVCIRNFADWAAGDTEGRVELRSLVDAFVYKSNNRLAVHRDGHVQYFRRDIEKLPEHWEWDEQSEVQMAFAPPAGDGDARQKLASDHKPNLSVRARKAIMKCMAARQGLEMWYDVDYHKVTLGEVEEMSVDDILGCRGTGIGTLNEIRQMLGVHGLHLKGGCR